MTKRAIITGIYGQDGSLLAEYLLSKKYRVTGIVHQVRKDFDGIEGSEIIESDITDLSTMRDVFEKVRPHECYHLAAAHHSSEQKKQHDMHWKMLQVNFVSTQAMLYALLEKTPHCRFLYAGSSQMFTPMTDITLVDENTAYQPSSYYGLTKTASAQLIDLLRRENGLWGLTVILFNHESTRRRAQFLSRKVTRYVANLKNTNDEALMAKEEKLKINDISARIDWSAATDFVRAMHKSLQTVSPRDCVLASGSVHSVKELLKEAFQVVGLDWKEYVVTAEVLDKGSRPCLQGNPKRAKENLGWENRKSFSSLIREMVEYDMFMKQT